MHSQPLQLRPYQNDAVDRIAERWVADVHRQVVRWPTGLGKTVLFSALPDRLKLSGRMLVLVHRDELAQQAADKLRLWNPYRSVGIEMGSSHARYHNIVVGSVPTLGRKGSKRLTQLDSTDFQVVVTDECHHSVADTYKRIYDHLDIYNRKDLLSLGMTATPKRLDGLGLDKVFQEIVHDFPMGDAIRQGYLVKPAGIPYLNRHAPGQR